MAPQSKPFAAAAQFTATHRVARVMVALGGLLLLCSTTAAAAAVAAPAAPRAVNEAHPVPARNDRGLLAGGIPTNGAVDPTGAWERAIIEWLNVRAGWLELVACCGWIELAGWLTLTGARLAAEPPKLMRAFFEALRDHTIDHVRGCLLR